MSSERHESGELVFLAASIPNGPGPAAFELQVNRGGLKQLLAWLRSGDLPTEVIIGVFGLSCHFRTYEERYWFACGFERCWNIFDDEIARLDQELAICRAALNKTAIERDGYHRELQQLRLGQQMGGR